jgi:2-oxoisovalerate dehydrogenase E2 component (dihydrolipoyl transacylase)
MSPLLLRRISLRHLRISHGFHSTAYWNAKKLQTFNLADIGEGITECEVIRWSVKPNATVQSFDMLCEVQSDKATVEITSPFDGVVKSLMVQEGEVAKVGSGLCQIETEEDDVPEEPAVSDSASNSTSTPAKPEQPATAAAERSPPPTNVGLHPLDPGYVPNPKEKDVLATPSTRHFARSQGVDLTALVPGSGKDGRIERKDVEAYLASGKMSTSESSSFSTSTASPSAEDAVVEMGRTRYGMWKAMVKSLEIPHFGYTTYLDLTAIHGLLPVLNANIPAHYLPESPSQSATAAVSPSSVYPAPSQSPAPASGQFTRMTYLPFLVKTLSKAMIEWPLFRSSISTSGGPKPNLAIRPSADVSIALSTPTGLYTPTIQSISTTLPNKSHDLYSLASTITHLSNLGRKTPCGLTPKEMPKRGGTVTVSNVGAIGQGEVALPRLVEGGGVAIVAIGRAKWVWDVNTKPEGERRLKVGVSWSADHRIVEGAELAAFVETWRSYVEQPHRLIAEAT